MDLKLHENKFHIPHFCYIWEMRSINYKNAKEHVGRDHRYLLNHSFSGSFVAEDITDNSKLTLKPNPKPKNSSAKD